MSQNDSWVFIPVVAASRCSRSKFQFGEHNVAQLSKLKASALLFASDRKSGEIEVIRQSQNAYGSENRATMWLSFPS